MADEQPTATPETQQAAAQQPEQAKPQETARSYSEEDVNRIVKERLARERAKHSDYDDMKRKAGEADTLQSELEKSKAETEDLRAKVAQAEHERQLAGIRSTIASKYGINDPTVLAVGDDEEQIDAYAQKLMKTFRPYDRLDQAQQGSIRQGSGESRQGLQARHERGRLLTLTSSETFHNSSKGATSWPIQP